MWRIVRVRWGCRVTMCRLRVLSMMRFWNSASVAAHAMLRRMSQKDEATIVFNEYFNAGCCLEEFISYHLFAQILYISNRYAYLYPFYNTLVVFPPSILKTPACDFSVIKINTPAPNPSSWGSQINVLPPPPGFCFQYCCCYLVLGYVEILAEKRANAY